LLFVLVRAIIQAMSDFSFGVLDTSIKMSEQDKKVKDILLTTYTHDKEMGHLLFLVEKPLPNPVTGALSTWVRKQFPQYSYDIVTASILDVSVEKIKEEGIYRFYKRAQSDFKKFIRPDRTIVCTLGMAINAITLSPDISVSCFYDYIFNKTYFYSPETDTYVVPIDGVYSLLGNDAGFWAPKDCSRVQFALHQFQQIKSNYASLKEPPAFNKPTIITVDTRAKWKEFYLEYKDKKLEMAWDTETSGLHFFRDRVGCFTCSFDGKKGYYIDWEIVDYNELNLLLSNKIQIFQNGKFDVKAVSKYGLTNAHIHHDTLTLAHMLNEMRFNGLKSLAYHYTPYGGYDRELDEYMDRYDPENYLDIPMPILRKYATMDPVVTMLVYKKLIKQMDDIDRRFPPTHENGWTLRKLYETVKIPALNKFVQIELRGVYVDMEVWDRNAKILQDKIVLLKKKLNNFFGINEDSIFADLLDDDADTTNGKKSAIQSTMKLGKILEGLGWENFGRAKNKVYLTGDDQLLRWIACGHQEAKDLQAMRSLLTLQKTFMGIPGDNTTGWRKHVVKHPDGSYRIHPSYNVMLMNTHRNGCSSPNWQQLPSSALNAELFKQIITVPDKDKYVMILLDMQGFQLHLCALDQADTTDTLYQRYLADPSVDLHSATGYKTFAEGQEFLFIEDGEESLILTKDQRVSIIRGGEVMFIQANDLLESDEFYKEK